MSSHIPVSSLNQLPLFYIKNEDDELLSNSPHARWYSILKDFPWRDYRELAAAYYNALYDFNKSEPISNQDAKDCNKTKDERRQQLLFDRPTLDKSKPVLYEVEPKPIAIPLVSPEHIAPGIVPNRLGGKKPKCFFALFFSFLGTTLMNFPPEPETVFHLLSSNLSFARVCGFVPHNLDDEYWFKNVPSLRKLQQFDQIMTSYGLWNQNKWDEVRRNIENGIIQKENELVGDTTHYHAYSGFETVKYTDENGKEKTKSQSKITKNCRCDDQESCHHPWELADDGAGTIVKSPKKLFWGHKASIIGLPRQEIPLDAIAVADASTFDGETLIPHIKIIFDNLPQISPWIDTVLYDSAADADELKNELMDIYQIQLKASINPRRNKTITENLPAGMASLSPIGTLTCNSGFEMDYQGARFDFDKYIYQAPSDEQGQPVCLSCPHKSECSPSSTKGRTVTIAFTMLPCIDSQDPQMAKRFKSIMRRRPSVERMIKRLKCDLSDDRLSKRGNASFQAYLDKSLSALHILLRN